MGTLPDDLTLRQLSAGGMKDIEIAERYGVTRQAVSNRLARFTKLRRPAGSVSVLGDLPWDLQGRPDKRRLWNQRTFNGLRYYVMKRKGQELSERALRDLGFFLDHVQNGEVLDLHTERGFIYVPREEEDGDLVVRWPKGEPLTPARRALFQLIAAEDAPQGV